MSTPTRRATTDASATAADWQTSAACRGCDVEEFFNDQPGPQARLQGICRGCPVRLSCLSAALRAEDPTMRWGVVGGLTSVQRRALHCEALLGNRPHLGQARDLASPRWAARMMPLRERGLTPEQIAVELRGDGVVASAVTVRLALWWAGGRGDVIPRGREGDERHLWELVRDEGREVVERLTQMGIGRRDVAAYLLVSEDSLGQAITAWRKADAEAQEVAA